MRTLRRALVGFVAMLSLTVQGRADAAIDLTGDWNVHVDIEGGGQHVQPIQIVQTGTVLEWFFGIATPTYTGTIDVDTGAFSVSGGTGCLVSTYNGTAAADSTSFTADGTEYGPPVQCASATVHLTGARVPCGDGVLNSGEECDDGNNLPNDCCSILCQFDPVQSACSDGNSLTCERCDGAGACQNEACPSLDLTGAWIFGSSAYCIDLTQAGSTLYGDYCGASPAQPFSGAIDPFTGHFVITQPPNACYLVEPQYCVIDATAALNGLSWSGTFECSKPVFPQPPGGGGCSFDSTFVSASREVCGDNYLNQSTGEQCDDGNTVAGDCCSPTCQLEAAGSACSDGNPSTCDACDGFGTCVLTTCPTVLDHYKCYQGRDLKTPPFASSTVTTSDQFGAETVIVQKLKYVCTPVDKNGEGIQDLTTHLACYQIKGASLAPRPRVETSSQFQSSQFELKKPKLLCVPATKTLVP